MLSFFPRDVLDEIQDKIRTVCGQKYERFVDKSAKVLMAETVALTSDRMFVEIRYKSPYMETYMVKQIISPPIKLFTLAEIFICKQRNNKILTWYGAAMTLFRGSTVNQCYNNVYPVFIPCNRCFDWSGWFGHVSRSSGLAKTGHSERKKKKRQTEEEVGRQYQRVDRNGLCQLN